MEIMLHPEWSYQAVIYEMNVRQLTREGTLRAAAAKLGFLRDMGIDAVWLMPVYPIGAEGRKGSLGSYYSIRDYCAVDPGLGTMGDFDAFVAEAHRLGMKVLLDWVANHTARDARWVGEKPADWYERDAAGAPAVPWDWTDTAKLNYANRDVWRAEADAMEFWVRRHAVDGFRCDMAMLVPVEFWNETARRLRKVNPDLFLLAEAEEDGRFHRRWLGALAGGVLLALPMALLRAQGMERALSLTPLRALAVGLVGGVGTVVPGLSTSFILINLGWYQAYLDALAHPQAGLLALVALGFAASALVSMKAVQWLFDHARGYTCYAVLGFLLVSVALVFPGFGSGWTLWAQLAALLAGLLVARWMGGLGEPVATTSKG